MAWWEETGLGIRVNRPAGSLGALANRVILFNVVGGEVLLTCLYFVCTIAPAGGANAVVFDCTPTAAGAGAGPMDNGAGDINTAVAGEIMSVPGNITLPAVTIGVTGARPGMSMPFICTVGTIGITKAAALDAGTWRGTLFYFPLTLGAYVAAA